MADIYKMAAPSGITVDILTSKAAGEKFQADALGDMNIFLLFKNIQSAKKAFDAGVKFETIQLGGVPNEAGKKMIFTAVSLGEDDVNCLKAMHDEGVNVELQVVPEESKMTYEEAMKKYNA